jgi:hypothetical protein
MSDSLFAREITARAWLSENELDPGTYYVMARAYSRGCGDPACIEGFSNVLRLIIPKPMQSYRASVRVLRGAGVVQLRLTVSPLGQKLPYRMCWTRTRGTRCVRATVHGYSWNSSATDVLRVPLRDMRRVTTFTWYAEGQAVRSSASESPVTSITRQRTTLFPCLRPDQPGVPPAMAARVSSQDERE